MRHASRVAGAKSDARRLIGESEGKLIFHVDVDLTTGQLKADLRAATLRDPIEVQCGLSITSGALHRKCEECPSWFIVDPGFGRPEKRFCSNACRVRGMRRRKRGKRTEAAVM